MSRERRILGSLAARALLLAAVAAMLLVGVAAAKPRPRDSDHDGLSNRLERRYHTNLHRRDTDHDGLSDGREVHRYHTNPRRRDTDHDGYSDGAEVHAGTNPRSRASHPRGAALPRRGFPNAASTGVPAGWTPTEVIDGTYTIDTPGALVHDLQVNGDIQVTAPNVTLQRVDVIGGSIDNRPADTCANGMTIQDSTVEPGPTPDTTDYPAIQTGGYTADHVKILDRGEGFRVGGNSDGCGPVTITNSYVKILSTGDCEGLHSDGIQGFDGNTLTLTNTTIDFNREGPCIGAGTSPFFYPDQSNTSATINGLLVMGGGINFRLLTPGSVTNLNIVDHSWEYAATDVNCTLITHWDAKLVTINTNYDITGIDGDLPCDG